MKKIICIAAFCFFLLNTGHPVSAQYNYVANPSFEDYDSIAVYFPDSTFYRYWYYPVSWFNPVSCGLKYYFNAKLNHVDTAGSGISPYGVPDNPWNSIYPYDGLAHASFTMYLYSGMGGRIYLENKLLDTLAPGKKYCVRFHVTLIDMAGWSIDRIGAVFSRDSLLNYNNQPDSCYFLLPPDIVSPAGEFFDIRNKWYSISGIYTAQGGEGYLTIGSFDADSNCNYMIVPPCDDYMFCDDDPTPAYQVDMVSVIECDETVLTAYAGSDTTICLGDSLQLGTNNILNGYEFYWSPSTWLSDSSIQNPTAKPQHTITYTLQQSYYSNYHTFDAVTLTVIDCTIEPPDTIKQPPHLIYIPNIFSPNGDGNNDVLYARAENVVDFSFKIYNRWGNLIFEANDKDRGWDGKYKGKDCLEGVYFYVAEATFANGEVVTKTGNITIVR